ncbi:MAG: sucrose phosphorylase [Bermanella sp.]|jgi:sucrose phosphorylase
MNHQINDALKLKVISHLSVIYPDNNINELSKQLIHIMGLDEDIVKANSHESRWDEKDIWMITYGDSIQSPDRVPLRSLSNFMNKHLSGLINGVHVLPFFPYSSDDGFSVIDFSQVNESLGGWKDIVSISKDFHLMSDLVVNHCSSRSRWFENYKKCEHPGKDYFVTVGDEIDISKVVRPRTSPLLREVETLEGKKKVWCTFSHDQVDLNYENPDLLCEMINIIKLYLDNGVRIFRLDAVAFLWKKSGSPSIHLKETHEMVRLFRTLIEHHSDDAIIITETNVPNAENLSYLGNANEAHAVYNFSLPPLLLHTLLQGNCHALKNWLVSMPPSQMGTFYFNFIASHDGIGLRPAEGLLEKTEINTLANCMKDFGGRISWRSTDDGQDKPYELNITLFDALQGTVNGPDRWQIHRFICAHGVMLALEGVPAIYVHSMLATQNYYQGVEHTSQNRTINRYKWDEDELEQILATENHHSEVFNSIKELISIRKEEKSFHPNAEQFALHICDEIFGFWRQSINRTERIFCIYNITNQKMLLDLASLNLPYDEAWTDLISGMKYENIFETIELKPYQFIWLKLAN